MGKFKRDKQFIMGVKVDFGMKINDVVASIDVGLLQRDSIRKGRNNNKSSYSRRNIVCTTNPEFILAAQSDVEFKKIINDSYLSVPDGVGVIFAKNFLKEASKHNDKFLGSFLGLINVFKNFFEPSISGVDLAIDLCALSAKKNYTVFLLGGWPKDSLGKMKQNPDYDVAFEAKKKLLQKFPNLRIIGATSEFNPNENNDKTTISYMRKCMRENNINSIDIVFVAYGHSRQEKWLARNIETIPAKVGIGVGGTFDYLAGTYKRAPLILRRMNLEWFYRLCMQPWRIKRIIVAFLVFPLKTYLKYMRS